jgi:hypothetical protein
VNKPPSESQMKRRGWSRWENLPRWSRDAYREEFPEDLDGWYRLVNAGIVKYEFKPKDSV